MIHKADPASLPSLHRPRVWPQSLKWNSVTLFSDSQKRVSELLSSSQPRRRASAALVGRKVPSTAQAGKAVTRATEKTRTRGGGGCGRSGHFLFQEPTPGRELWSSRASGNCEKKRKQLIFRPCHLREDRLVSLSLSNLPPKAVGQRCLQHLPDLTRVNVLAPATAKESMQLRGLPSSLSLAPEDKAECAREPPRSGHGSGCRHRPLAPPHCPLPQRPTSVHMAGLHKHGNIAVAQRGVHPRGALLFPHHNLRPGRRPPCRSTKPFHGPLPPARLKRNGSPEGGPRFTGWRASPPRARPPLGWSGDGLVPETPRPRGSDSPTDGRLRGSSASPGRAAAAGGARPGGGAPGLARRRERAGRRPGRGAPTN